MTLFEISSEQNHNLFGVDLKEKMLSKLWKVYLIFVVGVLLVKSQNDGGVEEKGIKDKTITITETDLTPLNSGKK